MSLEDEDETFWKKAIACMSEQIKDFNMSH
jgi:hypothetical protein